jgi:hypothetical protein
MNKLLSSVLGLLTATATTGLPLQAADTAPRLVIGIHIDQFNEDYLEWFMNGYGENGFRKILQSGTHYQNMVYGYPKPDNASACASFSTGCSPRQHGIIAKSWFDRATEKKVSVVYDPKYLGNYTQATVSPKNLLGSTLGDELKQATDGEAKVFAVGIHAEEAILLGGHSANGVYWLDETTGKWCTSTWYNYMPWWLQNINDRQDMGQMVEEASWTPLKPLENYRYMPHQQSPTLFQYLYNKLGNSKFQKFMESPMMNAEIGKVAAEILEKEQMGRDNITDYLVLQMSASAKLENKTLSAIEIQDIYFRLDQEIANLMTRVDQQVGLENVAFYLTGTGSAILPPAAVPAEKAYNGDFYPERCLSLLNLYLMATYGNDKYVIGWNNQEIFLNRKRIEEKGINYDEISRKAAEFLAEFSGVQSVQQYRHLLLENSNNQLENKANAIHPEHSGDLFLEIQGGWNVRNANSENDYQVRAGSFSTPFILYMPERKAKTIDYPVSAGDITASLSNVFRIRPPNACQGRALTELK